MLKTLFKNSSELRIQLVGLMLLMIANAILASLSITMIIPVTESILDKGIESYWFSKYIPESFISRVDLLIITMCIILLMKSTISFLRHCWAVFLSEKTRAKWQVEFASKLIKQPYYTIIAEKRGNMISNLTRQVDTGSTFILNYLSYISNIVITVILIITMLIIEWKMLLVIFLLTIICWFTIGKKFYAYSLSLGKKNITFNQQLISQLSDSLIGIRDIKIFVAELNTVKKINKIANLTKSNRVTIKIVGKLPIHFIEIIATLILISLIFYFLNEIDSFTDTIPTILFLSVGYFKIIQLMANISSERFKVINKYPSYKLVTEKLLIDLLPEENLVLGKEINKLENDLVLKNIDFSYINNNRNQHKVFNKLNITLPKSKITYIYGTSGSGKTTLVDLIIRLYSPSSGEININGEAIENYRLDSWRKLFGYVSQDPVLFCASIKDNIRLGDKNITDNKIREACKLACINEFIDKLSNGMDTIIGNSGSGLSGGQNRRIAIARALSRDISVLILDEATQALNESMEDTLIKNLKKNKNLTIIVISHRFSSVKNADVCYEITDGYAKTII